MSQENNHQAPGQPSPAGFTPPPTTVAELLARARRHGLELEAESEALETTGLDFVVALARDAEGTAWVVRAPRRADVVAAAEIEARALRLVLPRVPVAVPDWRVHAPELIAYPRIAGVPAISVTGEGPVWHIIDPAAPAASFIDSLARFLAALQSIASEEAEKSGVRTTTIAATRRALGAAMEATREVLQPSPRVWARWQRWLGRDALWPDHVALVHGDLHPGHLLLTDDARLCGVLDWTEARFDDPSLDLAMLYGCFGRETLVRLVDRFAAAGGRTWPGLVEHAGERWAAFAVLAAEWALRTGQTDVLAHARGHLATIDAETAD